MLGLGSIAVELLKKLGEHKPLVIVETGTLRDPQVEEAWKDQPEPRSTLAIAQWISKSRNSHSFHSIDISEVSLKTSREVLAAAGGLDLLVQYHHSDGPAGLRALNTQIDFALLDSDTNPAVILAEFNMAHYLIRWPGIVLIDDVYDRGTVNKGLHAIHEAERNRFHHCRIGQAEAIAFGAKAEEIILEVAGRLNESARTDQAVVGASGSAEPHI